MILAVLAPVAWIVGLTMACVVQGFYELAWLAEHPKGAATEEEMMAFGDHPNAFARWVLPGRLPVVAGFLIAKRLQ